MTTPGSHIRKLHPSVRLVGVLLLVTLYLLPGLALAQDMGKGGGLPYEAGLGNLYESMTGPVPFAISLLGIVGCGAMLIFGGEISGFMRTMVFIVLVVAVIMQAANIVNLLKGSSSSASVATWSIGRDIA